MKVLSKLKHNLSKYLGITAIDIFVLAEILFHYFAPSESTNWNIFYFSATTLSALMIVMYIGVKEGSIIIKARACLYTLFFSVLLVLELLKLNIPFDKYMNGGIDDRTKIILYSFIAIGLISITIIAWRKMIKQKG